MDAVKPTHYKLERTSSSLNIKVTASADVAEDGKSFPAKLERTSSTLNRHNVRKLERADSASSLIVGDKHRHLMLERQESVSSEASADRAPSRGARLERTESTNSLFQGVKGKPVKLSFALIAKQALEKKKSTER
jgi:hypothetical protein